MSELGSFLTSTYAGQHRIEIFAGAPSGEVPLLERPSNCEERTCKECKQAILFERQSIERMDRLTSEGIVAWPVCLTCAAGIHREAMRRDHPTAYQKL